MLDCGNKFTCSVFEVALEYLESFLKQMKHILF